MIHKDVSMSFWNSYKSVMLYSVFHYAQIVLKKGILERRFVSTFSVIFMSYFD